MAAYIKHNFYIKCACGRIWITLEEMLFGFFFFLLQQAPKALAWETFGQCCFLLVKLDFLVFCNCEGFAHLHLEEKKFCSSVIKYKVYMSGRSESSWTSHSSSPDRINPIY